MNFKALKKDTHFLPSVWNWLLKTNKVFTRHKKNTQNERGVGFIVDPHIPKGLGMGLSQIQSPSIAIEGSI
jgi:hypothetical protein